MNRLEVKYDFGLVDLESRDSLKLINDRIRDESLILEFGPANGRFTRHLQMNRHCIVDIVEYNPVSGKEAAQYARYALIGQTEGDIENYVWAEKLCNERYDFIVFADVLEHLYDPVEVLKRCRQFLKKDGAILLSVPNIANNNVILNLLHDEFEYTPIGILDDTHIRFFTYKSLNRIAQKLGYGVVYADYTLGKLGETEIKVDLEHYLHDDINGLMNRVIGNIYQLIYELKPDADEIVSVEPDNCFGKIFTEDVPYGFYSINDIYSSSTAIQCTDIRFINGCYKARFEISDLCKEGKFRFDPLEGRYCKIELINVVTDGDNCRLRQSNALYTDGNLHYFCTTDPIFEFEGDFIKATYIEFEYRIIKFTFKELFRLLKATKLENSNLYQELSAIKLSRGYKYLEKMRKIKNYLF